MTRAFGWATLVAGTLDIIYAAVMSSIFGNGPAAMLRTVASGPYPPATEMGAAGSVLGLIVHFTLMAVMARCSSSRRATGRRLLDQADRSRASSMGWSPMWS